MAAPEAGQATAQAVASVTPGWNVYRINLPHAHLQDKDCLFELPSRYEPIKGIGAGAYGVVCSAKDTKTDKLVAIKKINDAFSHKTDTKRLIRECKLLRAFDHYNIIPILDILPPKSWDFKDVYIISELMDTDLHRIISSPQKLTPDHVRYFMYQILRGTKYMHSANVCHRDLKPSNLLLNKNCDLKICDFGLSRVVNTDKDNSEFLTEYVATRWYRAPEVLLSWPSYTNAIDIWSIGCVFAELMGRKPLFPGSSYRHQVDMIIDVVGKPDEETIRCVQSSRAQAYVRALPSKPAVNWAAKFPDFDATAIDLLNQMLSFNPLRRINIIGCLAHPYFAALHDEEDEPMAVGVNIDVSWESSSDGVPMLKRHMYEEIRTYHPGLPAWPEEVPVSVAPESQQEQQTAQLAANQAVHAAVQGSVASGDAEMMDVSVTASRQSGGVPLTPNSAIQAAGGAGVPADRFSDLDSLRGSEDLVDFFNRPGGEAMDHTAEWRSSWGDAMQ